MLSAAGPVSGSDAPPEIPLRKPIRFHVRIPAAGRPASICITAAMFCSSLNHSFSTLTLVPSFPENCIPRRLKFPWGRSLAPACKEIPSAQTARPSAIPASQGSGRNGSPARLPIVRLTWSLNERLACFPGLTMTIRADQWVASDASGNFRASLPAGIYDVFVTAVGFMPL